MAATQELDSALDGAYEAMISHPDHALPAFHRKEIYDSLAVKDNDKQHIYSILGMKTVEYVLPVWEEQWPQNPLPRLALERARETLLGYFRASEVIWEANETQELLEHYQWSSEGRALSSSFWTGYAAADMLYAMSGVPPFGGMPLDTSDVSELGRNATDTAALAAIGYAGHLGNEIEDARYSTFPNVPNRRRSYWTWWLKEAIPSVLDPHTRAEIVGTWEKHARQRTSASYQVIETDVQSVLAVAADLEFRFPHSVYDVGPLALHYASHIEVRHIITNPNQPVTVPNCICEVCRDFLWRLALHLDQAILVADCSSLVEFRQGMQVSHIGSHLLQSVRESLDSAGLPNTGWEEWSSQRLVSSLSVEVPLEIRKAVFLGLLREWDVTPEAVMSMMKNVDRGDISPGWEVFISFISDNT